MKKQKTMKTNVPAKINAANSRLLSAKRGTVLTLVRVATYCRQSRVLYVRQNLFSAAVRANRLALIFNRRRAQIVMKRKATLVSAVRSFRQNRRARTTTAKVSKPKLINLSTGSNGCTHSTNSAGWIFTALVQSNGIV